MSILSEIFSWWGGNTWGTRVTLWCQGEYVGGDELGNRYYRQRAGRKGPFGLQRRWVVYRNLAEASQVPAEWHAWLHHMVDTPPTEEAYTPKPWQKPHKPNLTGTGEAYRPKGSILGAAERAKATGDYKAWRPE